jgi:hypothetical protein
VKGSSEVAQSGLNNALHSLQVNNEVLRHENDLLTTALDYKKKQKVKSHTLDLQQRKEFRSGAVFWSPGHLREARARGAVKQREKEEIRLQKKNTKELKEANRMY